VTLTRNVTHPVPVAALPRFLNAELSLLAFQRRVLSMAEDDAVPLRERLRFLAIVTSNLDELYMVRMAELRRAAARPPGAPDDHADGYDAVTRLAAVEAEIESLLAAQSRCAMHCIDESAQHGVHLLRWSALSEEAQAALTDRYLDEIHPDLSPMAVTLSPGVPLPHLPHLGLFAGIVFRATPESRSQFAEHELPGDVPRLLDVPGQPGAVIAIEEVLRANAHRLYPAAIVEGTYLFRVTRGGDLHLHEDHAADLLGAVDDATRRRPQNPAVRVEVDATVPSRVSTLILDNLRRDAVGRDMESTVSAVQVVHGLLDLRCLELLPLPPDPSLDYPPLRPADPFSGETSLLDRIAAGDLLLHHPFQSFDATVVRFFCDAAADPEVTSIQATLYRVGTPSPVVEALIAAAQAGKNVFALVELQARFDEAQNVQWARALERAGGRVVYGLPELKVHAKVALVTRVSGSMVQRFAHIGTGNYNPRSGRQYTDLSLFTSDHDTCADVATLLGHLTDRTYPVTPLPGGLLVAPTLLLPALLERIDREIGHARRGQPADIAIKVNGLADREIVDALCRASQAGVAVALIVRGICTLRPGVPGLSENIRVVSVVGRLLEHSRIYRFHNGGAIEHLIGSSDLRPRNLRRRVEVLVPVTSPAHQATLDTILDAYLTDGSAWELGGDGTHARVTTGAPTAQSRFVAGRAG